MTRIPFRNSEPPAPQPAKKPKLTRQRRKTLSEDAVYNAIRDVYLEQNPTCVRCQSEATEVHHIVRGKDRRHGLLNSDTWLAVCRTCHAVIEEDYTWELQACIKQNAVRTTIERLRK